MKTLCVMRVLLREKVLLHTSQRYFFTLPLRDTSQAARGGRINGGRGKIQSEGGWLPSRGRGHLFEVGGEEAVGRAGGGPGPTG